MFPVVTFRLTARSRRPSPSLVIAALRPREVWPVVTVHEGLSPASRRVCHSNRSSAFCTARRSRSAAAVAGRLLVCTINSGLSASAKFTIVR